VIFARKIPEFYIKFFFADFIFFGGGAHAPSLPPVFYAYGITRTITDVIITVNYLPGLIDKYEHGNNGIKSRPFRNESSVEWIKLRVTSN